MNQVAYAPSGGNLAALQAQAEEQIKVAPYGNLEEEDQWAANPWQEQVDAHIMQMRQVGAIFPPALGGNSSSSSHFQNTGMVFGASPQVLFVAPSPTTTIAEGAPVPNAELYGSASAGCEPGSPKQLRVQAGTTQEDLCRQNVELEGHIAMLEEKLIKKDKELAEVVRLQQCSSPQQPTFCKEFLANSSSSAASQVSRASSNLDAHTLMVDIAELRRRNDFLSMVVARFERKTMHLEEEIVALTLAKEEAGQLHRVNELEGQVVLFEDIVAQKDGELKEVLARLSKEEGERRRHEKLHHLDLRAKEDAEKLREENSFLSSVIHRFEQKTMAMEAELEVLSQAKEEASGTQRKLEACLAELAEANAAVASHRENECILLQQSSMLQQASDDAAERIEEQRQAAESATLALRDYKKDHNQKMQDLLRRTHALEKQKRDLETDLATAREAAAAFDSHARARIDSEECAELRVLNKQLIERLGQERADHERSKKNLADALEAADLQKNDCAKSKLALSEVSRENETLAIRVEQLVDQLYELATRNDALQEAVAIAQGVRGASDLDVSCQEGQNLHLMS